MTETLSAKILLLMLLPLGLAWVGSTATAAPADTSPVLMPVPDDPTVSVSLWFEVGSQDDPKGKEGLAYLTSQILANGATRSKTYPQILAELYPLAAGYTVRVDREMTTLSGRVHRDKVDAFLALFTAAFLEPKFDAADFERLKATQQSFLEKTLRFSSDEELGKAALMSAMFAGTSYAHPPQGTVAGVSGLNLDDVREFYRRHFTRDRVVLGLAGGFSAEVETRLPAALDRLPSGGPAPAPAPKVAPMAGRELFLVAKPGNDSSISFGFPHAVPRGEADFYALWLANSWLGEHRNGSSHLYQVIREARGLNYGDYSYIEAYPEGGRRQMPPTNVARRQQLFEVWIRTLPNGNAAFAVKAALRELEMLIANGMTEQQFQLTRSFLSKYVLHFAETNTDRLGYALDDRFYGLTGDGHLARFKKAMASLTREQVNAALKRHLKTDAMRIAIITGDAEGLKKQLLGETPTTITYASPKSPAILAEDEEIKKYPVKLNPEKVVVVPVGEFLER